jgi:protein subunit release factor B
MRKQFRTDIEVLKKQVVVETYRSSGPGGQRKNKKETAVRLRHLPSGVTVVATEQRSQARNLQLALERLRERLLRLSRSKRRRVPTTVPLGVVEKRRKEKKLRSAKKQERHKPGLEPGE